MTNSKIHKGVDTSLPLWSGALKLTFVSLSHILAIDIIKISAKVTGDCLVNVCNAVSI
jgi:hypothetical protein